MDTGSTISPVRTASTASTDNAVETVPGAPAETATNTVEVVVRGRNVVIPEHFRQHVEEKLAKLERYDNKIIRTDVELQHEKNPRQNGSCQHIEITCRTRGPVVRSEACAEDFYRALDLATDRLERRLRQAADRRRVHHGRRTPRSVAQVTAGLPPAEDAAREVPATGPADAGFADGARVGAHDDPSMDGVDAAVLTDGTERPGPGQVVREKDHPSTPMTVDQALLEMELVGHDFFLFCDSVTGRPSVVYRRHAYDYGLLRLTG